MKRLPPLINIKDIKKNDTNILKYIGNTPLVQIRNVVKDFKDVEFYAKLEWYNAGGSIKARPALQMILDGEKKGLLNKDKIILDSTSGNTGIAYALIGWVKGYNVEIVMPENVCKQRKGIMVKGFHATIYTSDPLQSSDGAIKLAKEIYDKDRSKYFMPDQYNNDSNWKAHFNTTAKEIIEQTTGRVTHFIAGIGTSGTIMGTGRGLKQYDPNIKAFAVEPAEALHGIEGLKHMESSIVPGIYREDSLDGKISVKTEDAYEMVRLLESEEGLFVGHSSGAAMKGAIELAKRIKKGVIVTVFPDSCEDCGVATGDY